MRSVVLKREAGSRRSRPRRRLRRFVEIDAALRCMASGDFGYCFVYGEAVDVRRLEAIPAKMRCAGCAGD